MAYQQSEDMHDLWQQKCFPCWGGRRFRVCGGAWNSAAFGTESSCIATIKLVRGNVYQATLLLKWGHCRQRGALLGGQHCKSLSFAAALFTYYSLYSSLKGPSNPPPPPLCMDHKAKDGIKSKCDFAASPVCCGSASMHDGKKKDGVDLFPSTVTVWLHIVGVLHAELQPAGGHICIKV